MLAAVDEEGNDDLELAMRRRYRPPPLTAVEAAPRLRQIRVNWPCKTESKFILATDAACFESPVARKAVILRFRSRRPYGRVYLNPLRNPAFSRARIGRTPAARWPSRPFGWFRSCARAGAGPRVRRPIGNSRALSSSTLLDPAASFCKHFS
jgi:hypothetical protein